MKNRYAYLMILLAWLAIDLQGAFGGCDPLPAPGPGQTVVTVSTLAALQSEIASAGGPKTIYLTSGTYAVTPSSFINISKPDITLRSATGNRDDVIIQGQGMAAGGDVGHGIYIDESNVTIADVTVRDIQNHGIFINPGCHDTLIHNVRIVDIGEQLLKASGGTGLAPKNNGIIQCSLIEYTTTLDDGDDGWYTNGIDLLNSHDWIIRDNLIRNIKHNPAITTELAGPAILVWQGSSGTLVERNRIIDCDFGISFGNAGGSGVDHEGGIIRNNFVKGYDSTDFGIGIIKAANAKVLNNTVYTPGGPWPYSIEARFSASSNCLIKNNLADEGIWGNRDGAASTLVSNITTATSGDFVNTATGDLHLANHSHAAVDAGTADADRLTDIDQETILDTHPDVGADEHFILGDLNVDGSVDLADAALGLNVITGLPELNSHHEADVNGDDMIDTADLLYHIQMANQVR